MAESSAACDAYIRLGPETGTPIHIVCERVTGHGGNHQASVFGFTGPNGGARSADLEWMT